MWLDNSWMQAGLEALRDTLAVDPRLRKQMIEFLLEEGLWDEEKLTWDAAIARWNACLNPRRPEFFKIVEIWALMKRFHRFGLFEAMALDLGFRATAIPTEERLQYILERIAEAHERSAAVIEALGHELSRLDDGAPPRHLGPAPDGYPAVRFRLEGVDDVQGGGF